MQDLSHRYHCLEQEKHKNDHACSQKLCEGTKIVQKLIHDLDETRNNNITAEQEQVNLLEHLTSLQ